jgi:protein-S-isoprenylcysteine O-methyltransferase Ste14
MARVTALELKIPPLVVLALAALAMWLTARATPQLIVLYTGRTIFAIAIAGLGLATIIAGVVEFRRANTTVNPHLPNNSTFVVTSGIYRVTRNPMYLGMLLVLIAWAAYVSNVATLVFPVLFVLYISRFQILPEERVLAAKFGEPYVAYLGAVRRWL